MSLIKFKINNKNYFINSNEWEKFNTFIKMGKKRNKSLSEITTEEEKRIEQHNTCEYCGRKIEDRNDTGSLCYRCYMREYYNS